MNSSPFLFVMILLQMRFQPTRSFRLLLQLLVFLLLDLDGLCRLTILADRLVLGNSFTDFTKRQGANEILTRNEVEFLSGLDVLVDDFRSKFIEAINVTDFVRFLHDPLCFFLINTEVNQDLADRIAVKLYRLDFLLLRFTILDGNRIDRVIDVVYQRFRKTVKIGTAPGFDRARAAAFVADGNFTLDFIKDFLERFLCHWLFLLIFFLHISFRRNKLLLENFDHQSSIFTPFSVHVIFPIFLDLFDSLFDTFFCAFVVFFYLTFIIVIRRDK